MVLWLWNDASWSMKKTLQKKARRFHYSRVKGDQTQLENKPPSKVHVKTAHAICESTKLFLDMERFHNGLDGKLVVLTRDNIV